MLGQQMPNEMLAARRVPTPVVGEHQQGSARHSPEFYVATSPLVYTRHQLKELPCPSLACTARKKSNRTSAKIHTCTFTRWVTSTISFGPSQPGTPCKTMAKLGRSCSSTLPSKLRHSWRSSIHRTSRCMSCFEELADCCRRDSILT